MKKHLLLFMLLAMVAGNSAWATKLYADLSNDVQGTNFTWNATAKTLSWTLNYSNSFALSGLSGDLSEYKTITINASGYSAGNEYRLIFYGPNFPESNGNHQLVLGPFYSNGGTYDLESRGITAEMMSNVTAINLAGGSGSGSIVIERIYLEKPFSLNFDEAGKAVIDITDMTASDGLSFNDRTGVLTTNGNSGELKVTFPSPVDLSALQRFEVSVSGDGNIITWTNFKKNEPEGTGDNPDKVHDGNGWWSSKFGLSFDATQAGRAKDVKEIILHSDGFDKNDGESDDEYAARMASLSLTISKMTITSNVITATPGGEKRIETLGRKYYDNGEWKTGNVTSNYGTNIGTPVGDGNATQDEYIELSGYNELRLYVSQGDVRIFVVKEDGFTPTADGYILTKDGVKQNGQWGGVQDTEHKLVKNGDYYYITIADLKAACGGQAKLIGVKAEYGQTVDISKVVVIGNSIFDYNISGSGVKTSSVTAALADASATSYDATGVTATGVELIPANPNALFVANAGALSNANNVIVDGTCANLVLTDGHPFAVPGDHFTATSASYTTTINAEAQAGTLALPFAAAIPEGVKAYTLYYTGNDEATASEVTSIQANDPVLLNGSGKVTFTGADTWVTIAPTNGLNTLVGVYEETTVPTGDYVLQNGDDGVGFYKVSAEDPITINPFRAYLTTWGAGAAKVRVIYEAEDATAITSLEAQDVVNETIYNLNGMRISHPTKGIYIKNGKKFIVK